MIIIIEICGCRLMPSWTSAVLHGASIQIVASASLDIICRPQKHDAFSSAIYIVRGNTRAHQARAWWYFKQHQTSLCEQACLCWSHRPACQGAAAAQPCRRPLQRSCRRAKGSCSTGPSPSATTCLRCSWVYWSRPPSLAASSEANGPALLLPLRCALIPALQAACH